MSSRAKLFVSFALVTAVAVALSVAGILVVRWAAGGPLSKATVPLVTLAVVSVGAAVLITSRADLTRVAPPSRHPWTVALATATVAFVAALGGFVPATLDAGSPGFLEVSLILTAGGAVLWSAAVWPLARNGRLDPTIAVIEGLIRLDPTEGQMTVPVRRPSRRLLRSEAIWGIGIGLSLVGVYALLVSGGPLGHDESVYAVKARSWLDGTPATGFAIYRPVGMPIVAWLGLQVSESAAVLRVFGAAAALSALGVLWVIGRSLFSPAAALLAVGMVAGAPSWLRRVPEFLNDIASTALLLAVMFLIWQHFERPSTSRWLIVLSAPLAAAAFYLRYGVVSALVIVAVVGAVVWRRGLVSSWRQLTATAVALGVLVSPHVVYAVAETGSVIGILTRATDAAGREYFGEGLVSYVRWFPERLAGPILGVLMALAVVNTVVYLIRAAGGRALSQIGRGTVFLGSSAILMIIASGLFVHAEERYVFPAILLLAVIGGHLVVETYRRAGGQIRAALLAVGALAIAGVFAITAVLADQSFDDVAQRRAVIEAAGDALRVAAGPDGQAISTYIPQITWYSGCGTVGFVRDPMALARSLDASVFVVVFEHGKRQPTGDALDAYVAPASRVVAQIDDSEDRIGDVVIYEFDPGEP